MKTINFKIAIKIFFVGVVSAILFSSCKKKEDEVIVYGDAKFRIVNAVQGSNPQDFYQGTTKINTSAVVYGQATDYLTVKAGNSTISFRSAGTQNVTATFDTGINTNSTYTVFYTNSSTGAGQIAGFMDDATPPASGKVRVRFVNFGAVLVNSINVSLNSGDAVLTGLAYGASSGYGTIDPNVDLKFSLAGGVTSTVIPGSSFQAGKIYTVWFDAANTTTAQYHIVTQN